MVGFAAGESGFAASGPRLAPLRAAGGCGRRWRRPCRCAGASSPGDGRAPARSHRRGHTTMLIRYWSSTFSQPGFNDEHLVVGRGERDRVHVVPVVEEHVLLGPVPLDHVAGPGVGGEETAAEAVLRVECVQRRRPDSAQVEVRLPRRPGPTESTTDQAHQRRPGAASPSRSGPRDRPERVGIANGPERPTDDRAP